MKCANCTNDAVYVLDDARVSTVYYCSTCLPVHLRGAAAKGHLSIPAPVVEAPAAPAKKKKAAAAPVVEEPEVQSTEDAPTED